MPFEPDPYRTLGLSPGATLEEIKRAYRRLAKANHPDAAGPAALTRFLAIQAAYETLAGPSASGGGTGRAGPAARPGPSTADPDRTEATRRAYGARSRDARSDAGPAPRAGRGRPEPRPAAGGPGTGRTGRAGAGPTAAGAGPTASASGAGAAATGPGPGTTGGDETRSRKARGKATLGSTSYDGADSGPFEPDWGGASWYGTTSGTYWTINPREYADPRKHGPEYQARARRATGPRGAPPSSDGQAGPDPAAPTHTTASWWESTAGPEETTGPRTDASDSADHAAKPEPEPTFERNRSRTRPRFERASDPRAGGTRAGEGPAPDPVGAAVDLGRALTDPRSGGVRARVIRAVLGWIPIALGIGWLVGELTGCGRFAATCDPSVAPLTAAGQGIVLAALLLLPEIAAIATGAAIVLLIGAVGASLILSATGTAADEASRRSALGALLVVAWLSGLVVAVVRRFRSGRGPSRPVS